MEMPFDRAGWGSRLTEELPAALGCMNLLEPRIAPEFSECGVTSGASRRRSRAPHLWSVRGGLAAARCGSRWAHRHRRRWTYPPKPVGTSGIGWRGRRAHERVFMVLPAVLPGL
jgi:hypothetical protein